MSEGSEFLVTPGVLARRLGVPDAFEIMPSAFPDERGHVVVPFQQLVLRRLLGHPMPVAQLNHNVSRRGVVRGVHYAAVPPGQAKYVHCVRGVLLDIVVDLRIGSPTFGHWDAVRLTGKDNHAVYLGEGLGHACMALADDTAMSYLCSTPYDPGAERGIDPLDLELGLPWPARVDITLSERDATACSFAEAIATRQLPRYADCRRVYSAARKARTPLSGTRA